MNATDNRFIFYSLITLPVNLACLKRLSFTDNSKQVICHIRIVWIIITDQIRGSKRKIIFRGNLFF